MTHTHENAHASQESFMLSIKLITPNEMDFYVVGQRQQSWHTRRNYIYFLLPESAASDTTQTQKSKLQKNEKHESVIFTSQWELCVNINKACALQYAPI